MAIFIIPCDTVEVIACYLVINDNYIVWKESSHLKLTFHMKSLSDFSYEALKWDSLDHGSSIFPARLANV